MTVWGAVMAELGGSGIGLVVLFAIGVVGFAWALRQLIFAASGDMELGEESSIARSTPEVIVVLTCLFMIIIASAFWGGIAYHRYAGTPVQISDISDGMLKIVRNLGDGANNNISEAIVERYSVGKRGFRLIVTGKQSDVWPLPPGTNLIIMNGEIHPLNLNAKQDWVNARSPNIDGEGK